MRPRYGRSLNRTGEFVSSSDANETGALELKIDPPDDEATTSREGVRGDEVSRTLLPLLDVVSRATCAESFAAGEGPGGPSSVASIPADSSRATISSASSRGSFVSRNIDHVLVSVS